MRCRFRHTLALTLTAVLCGIGAMVSAEPASAFYRAPVNPVTVELNWPSAWGKLKASGDFFACEITSSCTPVQKTRIGIARRAAGSIPRLGVLGTITLVPTAFAAGWKIGRVIDEKFLHLSGNIGIYDSTLTAGALWTYSPTYDVWFLQVTAHASSGLSGSRIEVPTQTGGAKCSSSANCGSQWAIWKYWYEAMVSVGSGTVGSTRSAYGHSSTYNCGNGAGGDCMVWTWTGPALEETLGANELPEPYVSQTVNRTSTIASPVLPTWGSAAQADSVAALVEDAATAEAAAATPAEEDTSAWQAGTSVDPDWSGYEGGNITMPDCDGLTSVECADLLEAAGHLGTITELELDIATADVSRPAGAVVTQSPGATVEFSSTDDVELTLNPDPMPVVLPAPLPTETYTAYIARLAALGWVGTATVTELSEAVGVPALGPAAPVTVRIPTIGTIPGRTIGLPGGWPTPDPRVEIDTPIEFWKNPTTYPPVTAESVPPATGGGVPPAVDFSPITDIDFGCKFPYGFICYAIEVTEWFNVTPHAPVFTFALPTIEVLGHVYDASGSDYEVDLSIMDEYMVLIRGLISVALWIGGVYFLAVKLLGFNAGGDPGEAADEGMIV